jgi:hypothetical protein
VGDGDPLVAVDDAVRTFDPNEIVISTHPLGKSNWLERGVVESIRARYDVPVTHVVVDLGRETRPRVTCRRRTRRSPRLPDLLIVELALERRMAPWPFVTRLMTRLFGGFAWSRFGPTFPDVPASASVWQDAQFVVKIVLPSVGFSAVTRCRRRRRRTSRCPAQPDRGRSTQNPEPSTSSQRGERVVRRGHARRTRRGVVIGN